MCWFIVSGYLQLGKSWALSPCDEFSTFVNWHHQYCLLFQFGAVVMQRMCSTYFCCYFSGGDVCVCRCRMHKCGILCPSVVLLKKHVLVMSFIGADRNPAPKLKDAKLLDAEYELAYDQCLQVCTVITHYTLHHGLSRRYDGSLHCRWHLLCCNESNHYNWHGWPQTSLNQILGFATNVSALRLARFEHRECMRLCLTSLTVMWHRECQDGSTHTQSLFFKVHLG